MLLPFDDAMLPAVRDLEPKKRHGSNVIANCALKDVLGLPCLAVSSIRETQTVNNLRQF